jgi:hypothetical protein
VSLQTPLVLNKSERLEVTIHDDEKLNGMVEGGLATNSPRHEPARLPRQATIRLSTIIPQRSLFKQPALNAHRKTWIFEMKISIVDAYAKPISRTRDRRR